LPGGKKVFTGKEHKLFALSALSNSSQLSKLKRKKNGWRTGKKYYIVISPLFPKRSICSGPNTTCSEGKNMDTDELQ
jgi:hypothetical protein